MAKKQQIILTHGTGVPQYKDVKLGEVLVRHAEDVKEAALYTPNNTEDAFVEFPSKAWVSNEITQVNTAAGELEKTVTALQTQVDEIDAAYKAADTAMEAAYKAADADLKSGYENADAALKAALEGADAALEGQIGALDTRVTANEGAIADLQAADTAMEAAYKAADEVVVNAYKAADTALETKLQGNIDKKADSTTVEAINGRLTTAEGEIDALQGEDTKIRGEFAAADTALETAYKKADADLKTELNAEIAKKADSTTVEAINGRLTTAEGEIDALQAADTAMETAYKAADDEVIAAYKAADTALETKLQANIDKKADNTTVTTLSGRVDTIQGEDTTKSMREVAAEEAAKEVAKVVANADEDFDTLKEIADWILSDKDGGAAALQADVDKLKDVTDGYEGKGAIKNAVTAIDGRLTTAEGEIDALQAEDTKIREDFAAADEVVVNAYKAADTALETKLQANIDKKADNTTVEAINGRLTTAEGEIDALQAEDTKIREDFAAADTALETAYKAADAALKTELNAEIAKKADSTTVEAINGRLTTAEGEIDALQAEDTKIRGEFAAADTALETAYKAADTKVREDLSAEIAKKADSTTVEAIDERVVAVEGAYVKEAKVVLADGTVKTFTPVDNVLDLSEMIIDGGTY